MRKVIKEIQERNIRVEADKAWETSLMRMGLITVSTYFIVVLWLWMIKAPYPWLNAFIPAGAFVLSTLSLPFLKKLWIEKVYKK